MRYFVLSHERDGELFIVAEVVREFFDDGAYRGASFAAGLAADASDIVLEEEFARHPAGARALAAGRAADDSAFDAETETLLRAVEEEQETQDRRRGLRMLQGAADRTPALDTDGAMTALARRALHIVPDRLDPAELFERARMTIEKARVLVTVARQRQAERRASAPKASRREEQQHG